MSDDIDVLDLDSWHVSLFYLAQFVFAGVIYLILHLFWGRYELLHFSDLNKPFSWEGVGTVWFIFVWAIVATVAITAYNGRPRSFDSKARIIGKGIWLSANAGFFEELIYRWLVFFSAMIVLPFFNLITFGLVKWLYTVVLVPLANWATFHALAPWLLHPGSWVLGAAIVSAAAQFRDEHKYLGLLGWVNSWFLGMVMFYLALNYGLLVAIVAHILYDAIIFTIRGLAIKKPRFYWKHSRFI